MRPPARIPMTSRLGSPSWACTSRWCGRLERLRFRRCHTGARLLHTWSSATSRFRTLHGELEPIPCCVDRVRFPASVRSASCRGSLCGPSRARGSFERARGSFELRGIGVQCLGLWDVAASSDCWCRYGVALSLLGTENKNQVRALGTTMLPRGNAGKIIQILFTARSKSLRRVPKPFRPLQKRCHLNVFLSVGRLRNCRLCRKGARWIS